MAQPQSQMPQMRQMSPQMPSQMSPQMSPQMSQMQHQQHQQHQPHQPQQMAPRPPYSPAQHSPSPVNTQQQGFALPPNKRPRTSPGPQSQPASPYVQSPYAMSPQAQTAPQSAVASPSYSNLPSPAPQQQYATPYTNGNVATPSAPSPAPSPAPLQSTGLHLPDTRQPMTPGSTTPITPTLPNHQNHQYTTATMAPITGPPAPSTATTGLMPPPSKPIEKAAKDPEYDVTDALAGTGVDLRAEEQYAADLFAGAFAQDAKTGLPANPPGSKASFYGAGFVNQAGLPTDGRSQEEIAAEFAKRAWEEAAHRLGSIRSNELKTPFLEVNVLHHKADKIAKEHGLTLNLDLKNVPQIGKLRHPQEFQQPRITVETKTGPDGALVITRGSWIPHDAYLADQMALLSIATKHRLRGMLEEANSVARIRQTTSHGEVPEEWADVAVPLKSAVESAQEGAEGSAAVPANPLKRSFDATKTGGRLGQNHLTTAMRDSGKTDRQVEESRLKKRQKRLHPETATGSRAGSAAPGTPGSVAPEMELKAPSKKEQKKGAAKMAHDANSTASANQTLNTLMGGFGGKKKKKAYSWMTGGGSGASTPRANTQDSGAASAQPGSKAPEKTVFTQEGKNRLGTWREDTEKGKNIQLRDWVAVLEMDGIDVKALQAAYIKLDSSTPK